jgi:hypothetical protein
LSRCGFIFGLLAVICCLKWCYGDGEKENLPKEILIKLFKMPKFYKFQKKGCKILKIVYTEREKSTPKGCDINASA